MGDWAALLEQAALASSTPGAVLGVWHDGVATVVPYGVLSTRTEVPTTIDSVFQIGSITKTWTATMVVQLVEEGRLSLDTPVAEVLPAVRLGSPDVSGQVTVHHLLTHASGLDGDVFTDTGRGADCVELYVGLLRDVAIVHEPGAAYSYCNTGFVLLGRIVEVLDGGTWDESLRVRLTDPLGLRDVCTLPEEALLRRAAVGHQKRVAVEQWGLARSLGPAGLIATTATDLLTYGRQWLGDDVPTHLEAMTEPWLDVPEGGDLDAIGAGWMVGRWGEHRVIGHSGGTIGQSAQLRIVPDLGLVVCVLTNAGSVDAVMAGVVPHVVRELTGVEVPAAPVPDPEAAPGDLARHVGVYERREYRFEVDLDDLGPGSGLSVLLVPIGDLEHLSETERVRLHPSDGSGDRFVARSEGSDDPWTPFTFARLPDGTPHLFFNSRVAPLVGVGPR